MRHHPKTVRLDTIQIINDKKVSRLIYETASMC